MRRTSLVTSLLAAPLFAACGAEEAPAVPDAAPEAGGAAVVAVPGTTCPTCGMAVDDTSDVVEAGGMRFRVCNPRCGELVAKDPGQYAAFALAD